YDDIVEITTEIAAFEDRMHEIDHERRVLVVCRQAREEVPARRVGEAFRAHLADPLAHERVGRLAEALLRSEALHDERRGDTRIGADAAEGTSEERRVGEGG